MANEPTKKRKNDELIDILKNKRRLNTLLKPLSEADLERCYENFEAAYLEIKQSIAEQEKTKSIVCETIDKSVEQLTETLNITKEDVLKLFLDQKNTN